MFLVEIASIWLLRLTLSVQEYSFNDAVKMADNIKKIAKGGYNMLKNGLDGFQEAMTKYKEKNVDDIFLELIEVVESLPSKVKQLRLWWEM